MSSKQTTTSTFDQGPWSGQQPYIKDIFSQAQNLYNEQKNNPYKGDYIAQGNQQMRDLMAQAQNWYATTGVQRADDLYGTSNQLLNTGAQGSMDTAQALEDFYNSDRVGTIINDAGRIADNPYISGMVNAAMRDANRNASENALPSLYRNSAAMGNINSSRAALAQGVVERGLAEKTADISSTMRGDAYRTGLGIGFNNQQLGLESLNSAARAYDAMLGRGYGGITDAYNMRKDSINTSLGMGQGLQGMDQLKIDNELMKRDAGYNDLMRYYSIIGANNWGSSGSSTSTQKQQPGAAQIAGGVLGAVGSLFGGPAGLLGGLGSLGGMMSGLGSAASGLSNFARSSSPFSFGAGGYTGYGPFK